MDYLKIEYTNTYDFLERILYQKGFRQILYLDADVKKPEYPIEEEGVENGEKEFNPTFLKWQKRYQFEVYAPEFLVDALTTLPLHDNVWITFQNDESNLITDIDVDVDWEDLGETEKTHGCFAKVTVSFAVDYILVTACGENMTTT